MALYEGIALIQEKQAVVLDLGTDYTKFGFTGEAAPRCIIPSQYWCTTERRFKRVYDYKNEEELYDNLVHMLHLLYFRHVLVNPKERKVVVVESLLTPTLFRETLAKVLFLHYEVSGVMWADSARMCALTLGAPVVLVVSIGALETEVVAVVHGVPVLAALQAAPLGARAVHRELARLLDADLPDHVLEDIKAASARCAWRQAQRRRRRARRWRAPTARWRCRAPRASSPPSRCSRATTRWPPCRTSCCSVSCSARWTCGASWRATCWCAAAAPRCPASRRASSTSCCTSSRSRPTARSSRSRSSSSTARRRTTTRWRGRAARCAARPTAARARSPATCTRARGACATGRACCTARRTTTRTGRSPPTDRALTAPHSTRTTRYPLIQRFPFFLATEP